MGARKLRKTYDTKDDVRAHLVQRGGRECEQRVGVLRGSQRGQPVTKGPDHVHVLQTGIVWRLT